MERAVELLAIALLLLVVLFAIHLITHDTRPKSMPKPIEQNNTWVWHSGCNERSHYEHHCGRDL